MSNDQPSWATNKPSAPKEKSEKSFLVALLLVLFLGVLGIHRFYVGRTTTGLLKKWTPKTGQRLKCVPAVE